MGYTGVGEVFLFPLHLKEGKESHESASAGEKEIGSKHARLGCAG